MLIITTRLGGQLYGIPTRHVLEVTPLVKLREVPHAPDHVVGVCNYRGRVTPVVDLGRLLVGIPSRPLYSTRILFLERHASAGGVLGLMAEGVTETLELDDAAVAEGLTVRSRETAYLGAVVQHEIGLIQMFDLGEFVVPALPSWGPKP